MPRADARRSPSLILTLILVATTLLAPAGTGLAEDPLPDLVISSLTVSSGHAVTSATWPQPRDVTIVVENRGAGASPGVIVELGLIHPGGWREVLIAFQSFPLAPGASETFTMRYATPQGKVGDFELVATADPGEHIIESDPFNNARHVRVTAGPVPGVVYPARSVNDDPAPPPARIGDEWARYAFDRHDAGNPHPRLLLDRAGHGRDAWMPTEPPAPAIGLWGRAAHFQGATALSAPLPDTTALTLAFWMRADALPVREQVLWSTEGVGCERAVLALTPTGALRLTTYAEQESGCEATAVTDAHVTPGTWTHVALVKAGAAATVHVDGTPALAHALDGHGGFDAPRLVIGAHAPATAPLRAPLTGVTLEEFRTYARALTPAEVAVLAQPPWA